MRFWILAIRCFADLKNKKSDTEEKILTLFQKYLGKPLISMEAATRHPLQSLADTITIKEQWKETRKPKVVLTWGPHIKPIPHAVANSFAEWMNAQDVEFVITHPEGLDLDPAFVGDAKVTNNQEEALKDADFVYIKNWSSDVCSSDLFPSHDSAHLVHSSILQKNWQQREELV